MATADMLLLDNSGLAWVSGVVDDADPVEDDGSPKWINDADVDWELLDEDDAQVAAGSGVFTADGRYKIDLSHLINFAIGNTLHVTLETGDGFFVDIRRTVSAATRTGKTPTA